MLTDIPMAAPGDRRKPGTWSRFLAHTPEPECAPFWTAVVWCPDCGRGLSAVNHSIDTSGNISPSLGHPAQYPHCEWHTHPRLLGWAPNDWPLPPQLTLHTCENCGHQARHISGWGTWSGGNGIICRECFAARLG